jgi:antitoxin component HigA of HigAB toxin-antitoxin module
MDDLMEQPGDASDSDAASSNAAEDSKNSLAEQVAQDDLENVDSNSQEQIEEDEEEIEVGDRKLALPKSVAERLKSERMMHADYTQKTQTVAEERRQVAAEREQVLQQRQQAQEYLEQVADVRAIDKQLAEIDKINLAEYVDSDAAGVLRVQEQRRALEAQRAHLVAGITQKQNERALNEQQATAKQVQDAEAYLAREIKGITPERVAAIQNYATTHGMDVRAFAQTIISSPQVAMFAHKAELYDALIKKQAPKPQPAPAAKPAIRVAGASAAVKRDPTQMTDAEFAAHRRSVQKRR